MSVRILLKGWDTPRRTVIRWIGLLGATHIIACLLLFARTWYVMSESVESVAAAFQVAPLAMMQLVFGVPYSLSMTNGWATTVIIAYLLSAGTVACASMRLRKSRRVEVEDETSV